MTSFSLPVRCLERNAFQTPLTGGPASKWSPEGGEVGGSPEERRCASEPQASVSLPPWPPPPPPASSASRSAWSEAPGGFGWRSQNRGALSFGGIPAGGAGETETCHLLFSSSPSLLRAPVFHGHQYCTLKPGLSGALGDYNSDYIPAFFC